MEREQERTRRYIWLGLLGAALAAINTFVATISLGIFQGPFVAFSTPFVFALAKFRYPKSPGATLVFVPVIVTGIFTLNLGPPGVYKIIYLIGPLLYDLVCYLLLFHKQKSPNFKVWKLMIAAIFYPIGLIAGAILAIRWVLTDVEIPFVSKGLIGATLMVALFAIIGSFATVVCSKVFKKYLYKETTEHADEV